MLSRLRAVLADADYSAAGIAAALDRPHLEGGVPFPEIPIHVRRLDEGPSSRLATLIKLFALGSAIPANEATRALHPVELDHLPDLLETRAEGMVQAKLRLTPYAGLIFAHDAEGPPPLESDYVMGIGPATRTLAGLTPRNHVESVLDIGSGCGSQTLLAAQHADQVIAVELNPRGVWLTRLNAELNAIDNVECRQGSLFEPVAGLAFDLIVSNPPYVISPDTTFVFRDSGRPGDTISRAVVVQSAGALREGAFAHVLCNWAHRCEQPWWEPLTEWVEGLGCDAWLLHYQSQDGPTYASHWHADLQSSDQVAYVRTLDRWVDYYRRSGIERIASGAVILRRRSAGPRNWIHWDAMERAPIGSGSGHAPRIFAAYDALETMTEADLSASVFRLADRHQLAQRLVYRDSCYTVVETTLTLEEGIGLVGSIPTTALPVLLRLDGERPVQTLVAEVAAESGAPVEELEPAAVQTVRSLFSRGLIDLVQARTR